VSQVANYKIKNAALVNFTKDIYEGRFKVSDRRFLIGLSAKPSNFNNEHSVLEISEELIKGAKKDFLQSKTKLYYGSPQLGPARLWF